MNFQYKSLIKLAWISGKNPKMKDFGGFLIKNLNLQICQELVDEQKSF